MCFMCRRAQFVFRDMNLQDCTTLAFTGMVAEIHLRVVHDYSTIRRVGSVATIY